MEHIVYVHDLFRVLVSTKRGVSDSLEFAHSKVSESNGTYQGLKNANWGTLEMLTRKQYELLRFISERLKESGVPPSFDEMKDALDLRSKSGIHRLITALEERGFIRRLPNRARAIEVIKLPEQSGQGTARRGFTPSVIEGTLGRVRTGSEDDNGRPVAIPMMGRIAAGTPIEAIQTKTQI